MFNSKTQKYRNLPAINCLMGVLVLFGASAPADVFDMHFEPSGGVPDKLVWQTEAGRWYDLWISDDLGDWSYVSGFPQTGSGGPMEYPFTPGVREFFKVTAIDASEPGEMVLIPAGSFQMGNESDPLVESPDELPVHSVEVSGFYMQTTEVTNDEMVDVLNWAYGQGKLVVSTTTPTTVKNAIGDQQKLLQLEDSECRITWNATLNLFEMKPERSSGYPCLEVTWYGCAAYCNWRSEREVLTPCFSFTDWSCDFAANGYRLPTEAEWEKAARGGLPAKIFPWGDTITHDRANFWNVGGESYASGTTGYHPDWDDGGELYPSPVGTFAPNGYGLHDMSGNVWEWCWDWYESDYYANSPGTDPRGPASSGNRVLRGGGWDDYAFLCRVASRLYVIPEFSMEGLGFRVARSSD